MPPTGRSDNDEEDSARQQRVDTLIDRIQSLDAAGGMALLDSLVERWNLDYSRTSFEEVARKAFTNFQTDIQGSPSFDAEDIGHWGMRQIDESINDQEQEAIALYHQLKTLDALQDPLQLRRIVKVLEMIFYAKKVVLSTYQARLAIHAHCTGVEEMVMSKDLDERLGSWSLRFRWVNVEEMNQVQKLLVHLLDVAQEKNYRKAHGNCFEPIVVDGHNTHAWRYVCDVKQFVYDVCKKELQWDQWLNLTNGPANAKMAIEYMTACNDYQFPDLVKNRRVFSFKNGVYLAHEDRFYEFGSSPTLSPDIVACKFFDMDFEPSRGIERWQDIPTPHLQSILDHQRFPAEVSEWLYILVGRLLYALGELDGWQVIPFFLGTAGSGKCFAAGTKILMYDGCIKPVEAIVPGELVMGDDSTPRTVMDLARGTEELYCISSKYGSVSVTREHILCLKSVREPDDRVTEMTVGEYLTDLTSFEDLGMYRRDGLVYAFDVNPVPGPQAYFGFQTDGNQRFCLADGTVTHNSTITLKVCKALYDAIDVGVLSNNIEKKFGLSAFFDKYLFVAPEIKSDLQIEQAEFQSIVSGEDIQVNVKHKHAFSTQWRVPGVLAGNEVPQWADNSGSIQRRIVVFSFDRPVTHGDMRLGDKLQDEMGLILLKANRAYRATATARGHENVWTLLPSYFQRTRDEMAQSVNSVEAFLVNLTKGEDKYCPFEDFKRELKTFERENGFSSKKYSTDFFRGPFAKFNLDLRIDKREYGGRHLTREYVFGVDIRTPHEEEGNALG